jgi:hypothetical protein
MFSVELENKICGRCLTELGMYLYIPHNLCLILTSNNLSGKDHEPLPAELSLYQQAKAAILGIRGPPTSVHQSTSTSRPSFAIPTVQAAGANIDSLLSPTAASIAGGAVHYQAQASTFWLKQHAPAPPQGYSSLLKQNQSIKDTKASPVTFKIYLFQRSGAINTASIMVSLPDVATINLAFYQLFV